MEILAELVGVCDAQAGKRYDLDLIRDRKVHLPKLGYEGLHVGHDVAVSSEAVYAKAFRAGFFAHEDDAAVAYTEMLVAGTGQVGVEEDANFIYQNLELHWLFQHTGRNTIAGEDREGTVAH